MSKQRFLTACSGLAMMLCAGSALAQSATKAAPVVVAETEIAREGEGARRDALNKRERKAFDSAAWSSLTGWTNGSALTATDTKDKVVLIATWSDYLPTSKRVPAMATRMAEKFGKQGLVVVLVHGEQQWDKATKPKAPEGTTLLVAHDAKGEFRKALDVDNDPDFYLIDRAGQLRFADVTLEAVDGAITKLIAEDAKTAAGISERLENERAERERNDRRARSANTDVSFTNIPDLPYTRPSDDLYEKAKWPRKHLDPAKQQNERGAQLESKDFTLPDEGWAGTKPNTEGKLLVVYDWHPVIPITYNGMFEYADQLQLQYPRDIVVVGAMSQFAKGAGNQQMDKKDNDPKELAKRFETFLKSREWKHALVNNSLGDFSPDTGSNAGGPLRAQADNDDTYMAPVLMLVSTDGKIRWWLKAEEGGAVVALQSALIDLLRNDPGVIARRKTEAEWIARQQGKSEAEIKAAVEAAAAGEVSDKAPPAPPK